jgi:hypothetical protein
MADQPAVHIGENSPEEVAYKLFREIVQAEGPALVGKKLDRKWILDTYAECMQAVRQPHSRLR